MSATGPGEAPADPPLATDPPLAADHGHPPPLYARALGLRHSRLARWQAVLLFDVAIIVGVLLALAEAASAWSPVVLPVAVALVVKAYDHVAGLAGPLPGQGVPDAGDPVRGAGARASPDRVT